MVSDGNRNAFWIQNGEEKIEYFFNVNMREEPNMHLLREGINMHDVLSKVLFTEHVMWSTWEHDIYWDSDDNVC